VNPPKKDLPAKSDQYLKNTNWLFLFTNAFLHQLGCRYFVIPISDINYWEFKSNHNTIRDENNSKKLTQIRIKYEILWECQIKEQIGIEVKRVIMRTTI
jgi:DNA mismatch endonuclease, patch repair protein